MRSVWSRHKEFILWLTVLGAASFLRCAPIASSLPYIDYVDEGYALHQAIHLLDERTWDTAWYGYPSLPAYLTAAGLLLADPFYRQIHGHDLRQDLPPEKSRAPTAGYDYDQISPPALILSGRVVAAFLSVATVLLAGMIGRKLRGPAAGFLALLITAVCPALVLRGSNVLVDTFATFFVLLTIYFCEQIRGERSRVVCIAIAGCSAAWAFASKYPAGAVFVAVLVRVRFLPVPTRTRVRETLVAIAGFVIGILTGSPATIFRWHAVVRDVAVTAANYRIMESQPGYFGQAVTSVELGWFIVLAGCFGLALMVRDRSTRPTVLSWFAFAAVLLAPFIGQPFQPFRNILPLAPLFCVGAAVALIELVEWAHRRGQFATGVTVAVVLVSAEFISSALATGPLLRHRVNHRDSRVRAIDWLAQHATKDERVLGVRELAILPAEWKRPAAQTTVVPWCDALDLLEREQFDYVVTGDFDLRSAPDANAAAACLARWNEKNAALPVVAEFGSGPAFVVPYLWHTNDERAIIRRASKTESR